MTSEDLLAELEGKFSVGIRPGEITVDMLWDRLHRGGSLLCRESVRTRLVEQVRLGVLTARKVGNKVYYRQAQKRPPDEE